MAGWGLEADKVRGSSFPFEFNELQGVEACLSYKFISIFVDVDCNWWLVFHIRDGVEDSILVREGSKEHRNILIDRKCNPKILSDIWGKFEHVVRIIFPS